MVDVERMNDVGDSQSVLTEVEQAKVNEALADYKAAVSGLLTTAQHEEMTFREFKEMIENVKPLSVPLPGPVPVFTDEYEHRYEMDTLFTSESRQFVYEQVQDKEWQEKFLEEWWAYDHPDFDVSRGYGVNWPSGEENIKKSKEVIETYNDFAFSQYR